MKYVVRLEESDEGFAVSVPGLPGCLSQGATREEALENIADAIREYLEVVRELARFAGGTMTDVEVPDFSPEGAQYHSLGQRPRNRRTND